MVGFSVLCSFQQRQVMFYKLCFLLSCTLVNGHKRNINYFQDRTLQCNRSAKDNNASYTSQTRPINCNSEATGKCNLWRPSQVRDCKLYMDSVRSLVCVFIHPGQIIETQFRLTNMFLSTRIKVLFFPKVLSVSC